MKGCLVAFALFVIFLIVLGVGCGGYMAYKGHELITEIDREVNLLYDSNDRWPFEAPEDGQLRPPRLNTFLEVRDQARQPISDFLNSVVHLKTRENEMGPIEMFKEAFGLVGKAMGAFRDVPATLNSSLSAREMSIDEYVWICETIHITLAKAERDGDREAIELVESLEDQNEMINIDVQDEKVSYHNMRRELLRRPGDWMPENLELIVENEEAVCDSPARILLDAIVVQTMRSPDSGSEESEK